MSLKDKLFTKFAKFDEIQQFPTLSMSQAMRMTFFMEADKHLGKKTCEASVE